MLENKRILVLSVSAWSSKVGSDTWSTLVEGLDPDNVASLSLREEAPDSPASNHYFAISENRVLKSILRRRIKTGRRLSRAQTEAEPSTDLAAHNRRYQKMGRKRGFFGLFAREVVWWLGKWRTRELDEFILSFRPDVILYAMEGYIHFNRICRYVKKKTGAKSVGYFWDDNFTYKQTSRLGLKAFRFLQRRSLKKLAKKTDAFWAITDMTKREADAFFGVDCTVVTKPLKREPVYEERSVGDPIRVLYTGNLQIGRDRSLVKVVRALEKVNEGGTRFVVDVYTKTQLADEVKAALSRDFCALHDPVPQSEVLALQEAADILLFLEDVDGPDAKTARLSFSTKITDYLSAGKSILAVGCMDTAPMQYFLTNDAALIATTEAEMVALLQSIPEDKEILSRAARRAYECGIKNHKKENILKAVHNTIEQLV